MYKDFVHTTKYIHDLRLRDMETRARQVADRREARATKRLRIALGQGLIAIGQRLVEHPSSEPGTHEVAA